LYRGRRVGGLGDVATFSFYGNKIITTGEGGMIVTNDAELASRMRLLKGQGMTPERRFWFPIVGYNYRMTNIQAAIGLAQLERIEWFIERRREVAGWYDEALKDLPVQLPCEASWARNVYWLYSIVVEEGIDRDHLMNELNDEGIETRPFFYPMHQMPPYFQEDGDAKFPVTTSLAARGINLPTSAKITKLDVEYVADALRRCLENSKKRALS
jgi:perosamine synthetase